MPNSYNHDDGCPICGAKECERGSDINCDICHTKCCHPNKKEWHWTQGELDRAEREAEEVAKFFEPAIMTEQSQAITIDEAFEMVEGLLLGGGNMAEAYCMKCKEKREIQDPEDVVMKNGRNATRGVCAICGTAVFKINKKTD